MKAPLKKKTMRFNDQEEIRRIFLIGLDELFDTRLGTLAVHHPSLHQELMASSVLDGSYHQRQIDRFGDLPLAEFYASYAKRGKDLRVLKHSVITNLELYLAQVLQDAINEAVAEPMRGMPALYINTYPYQALSKEAKQELGMLYQWRLKQYFNYDVPIVFIHKSPLELDPLFCHNTFKGMFMYNYTEWLNVQAEEYEFFTLPHTTITSAALYHKEIEGKEQALLDYAKQIGHSPLTQLAMEASVIVPITLVDVRLFSIVGHMLTGVSQAPSEASEAPKASSPIAQFEAEGRNLAFGEPLPMDPGQPAPTEADRVSFVIVKDEEQA